MLRSGNSKKKIIKLATMFAVILVVVSVMLGLMQPGIALTGGDLTTSDSNADVETEETWKQSFADVQLTDDYNSNLVSIANTQIGYKESELNYYTVTETDEHKGYTRYGAFVNDNYMNWDTSFVDFCMNYAGYPQDVLALFSNNIDTWIQSLQDNELYVDNTNTEYQLGDLVFFQKVNQETSKQVGIITEINVREDGTYISVIEGNCDNEVKKNEYSINDTNIIGYALIHKIQQSLQEEINQIDTTSLDTPITEEETYSNESNISVVDEQNDVINEIAVVSDTQNDIDFTDMITGVTMQYKKNQWDTWKDITDETTIEYTDWLNVQLEYTVPGKTFSSDSKTITYILPEQLQSSGQQSGTVENSSGVEVGTYSVENGVVKIIFYDEFVKSNENGNEINGWLKFNCSVNKEKVQESEKTTIKFNDKISKDITVKTKDENKGDITVKKTYENLDEKKGTVTYVITVSSKNGTSSEVNLSDIMTNTTLKDGAFVVTKNNQPITDGYTITANSDKTGFDACFPQMSAGDVYQIRYTAELPNDLKGYAANATNKVEAKSTNTDKKEIKSDAEVKVYFNPLVKKSVINNNDGTLTWTVEVNKSNINLNGWTLSDVLNGQSYTGSVNISPSVNGQSQITLPYTFQNDDYNTYTITYTTEVGYTTGANISNTAELNKDGYTPGKSDSSTYVTRSAVEKQGTGIEVNEDKTLNLNWKITIHITDGMENGWNLTDTLQNNQYLTPLQLSAIKDKLDTLLGSGNYVLKSDKDVVYSDDNTENWSGFKIATVEGTTWKSGNSYDLNFSSTSSQSSVDQDYKNKVILNDFYAEGTNSYKKDQYYVVSKVDANNPSGGDKTTHDNHDVNINGVIKWDISLNFIGNVKDNENIILTENLPSGVTLQDLSCQNQKFNWNGDEGTVTVNDAVITAKKNSDNTITITIPKKCYENEYTTKLIFQIVVKLDNADSKDWTQSNYTNSVTVTDENKNVIGTDTQTQEITNKTQISFLEKNGYQVEASNNVSYEVKINTDGEDLLQNGEGGTLTLQDILTYHYNPWWGKFKFTLVPNSVQLYYLNSDGTKGEKVSSDLYSYTYAESAVNGPNHNEGDYEQDRTNVLTVTVPDDTPLLLVYKYKADGVDGTNISPKNSASLSGDGESFGTVEKEVYVVKRESSAGADIQGINLYKVDSENYGIYLQGARFTLYKYDSTSKTWITVSKYENLISDSSGLVEMSDLQHNQAYRLVETEAPNNYKITEGMENGYEFVIVDSDTTKYPMCVPDDFNGTRLSSGQTVYFPNTKDEKYVLPSTGGSGTTRYFIGGAALMLLATFLYAYKNRHKPERRTLP